MDMGIGEGEMYGESNMETYITILKTDSCIFLETQAGALHQPRGMGGGFRREGIYVYLWLIHVEV